MFDWLDWLRQPYRQYSATFDKIHEAPIIDAVVKALQTPADWTVEAYTLNGPKIRIWIANSPYADMHLYEPDIHFTFAGSERIRAAVAKVLAAKYAGPAA